MHGGSAKDRDYVAEFIRWQDAGAIWDVVARTAQGVTIALLRCDGGEEVDRFTSDDERLLEFVRDGRV
ncbi:hypothetical protein ASD37_07040 [Mycobacterium sp. Root135]|uniref:hypothetical protein n=1 Tax=Mycobacterium sp. Root135 TaxID=1736457 RepID=UPI0006FABCB6|nr:hypothetical protein [Mycobacterium sp. Root135]KQY10085.1 hypothetical protein ASD37_07040 [Mycobacterium sp. Root135]